LAVESTVAASDPDDRTSGRSTLITTADRGATTVMRRLFVPVADGAADESTLRAVVDVTRSTGDLLARRGETLAGGR
jgi:hypothetical protein